MRRWPSSLSTAGPETTAGQRPARGRPVSSGYSGPELGGGREGARQLPRWCLDRATSQGGGGEADGDQDRRGVKSTRPQAADGGAPSPPTSYLSAANWSGSKPGRCDLPRGPEVEQSAPSDL